MIFLGVYKIKKYHEADHQNHPDHPKYPDRVTLATLSRRPWPPCPPWPPWPYLCPAGSIFGHFSPQQARQRSWSLSRYCCSLSSVGARSCLFLWRYWISDLAEKINLLGEEYSYSFIRLLSFIHSILFKITYTCVGMGLSELENHSVEDWHHE